ncbi:DUF2254 domain-containing protein [Salipiger profundus]|uniref:DUF2254 domain-containing protein n=1 Tax=Salipiger profundus TaxID=1229727 RepID=UPI0008E1F292|nr:DUF2254 domain-containing protein [Salipiger profundus]SFC67558.1 Uncharacterized membrane protein [Salipiger profundus]
MRLSKTLLLVKRVARNLAARVVFGAVLALAMAFLSPLIEPLLPSRWTEQVKPDAVIPILTILATTMLTVTTFSLSVMVQAFQTAASQATPRAYRLHLEDTTTQTVLATFTGAFLYALTALVMFRADLYAPDTAIVILGVTVLVIGAIVLAILRWIEHLSRLGSMDDTLAMVERQAREALERAMQQPAFGGVPLDADPELPESAVPVPAPSGGYIQFVDVEALHGILAERGGHITVTSAPGQHVVKGAPVAWLIEGAGEDLDQITDCFTIGSIRTPEQDSRFGIVVLSEVAARALSPGINDPGTAIDVIHRLTRLLHEIGAPSGSPPEFPRVELPTVRAADVVEDGFASLIRAGAGHPEVIGAAVEALRTLEGADWPGMAQAARRMQGYALRHGKDALSVTDDRDGLAHEI